MLWTLWVKRKGCSPPWSGWEFPTKEAAEEYFITNWDYEERQQLKHKIEKIIRPSEVLNV